MDNIKLEIKIKYKKKTITKLPNVVYTKLAK